MARWTVKSDSVELKIINEGESSIIHKLDPSNQQAYDFN